MAEHFRFEMVKAGNWHRYDGKAYGDHGQLDEDRPHFVAQTKVGDRFVQMETAGCFGTRLGLCPGWVLVEDKWVRAYRFRGLSAETAAMMLRDLDVEMNRLMTLLNEDP
jgi:hypothetical protein